MAEEASTPARRFSTGLRIRPGAVRPLPFMLSARARAAEEDLPDRTDNARHVPYVVDQDGVGVCFACAPAVGVMTTLAARGTPLPFHVSILDLATLVHAIERAITGKPKDPLYDWGGDPADVVTAISRWGVRPARYRPGTDEEARLCDASKDTVGPRKFFPGVDEPGVEPNLLDLEKDSEALMIGAHSISTTLDVRRNLAAGVTVGVAWRVLDSDQDAGPDAVLDAHPDRDAGSDHYTLLVDYERQPDGSYLYVNQNSWGYGWGHDGRVRVTEGFMRQADCLVSFDVKRGGS